jgi:hypothetical protein
MEMTTLISKYNKHVRYVIQFQSKRDKIIKKSFGLK